MTPPTGPTSKGERTRAAILDAAFRIVSKDGLEGLTIGTLAAATGMSKSGLFAHFGSRDELLIAVMDRGQQEFLKIVVNPALARPRGLPRLRALFVNWIDWTESADLPGGCPMIGGAIEFDDKPGQVRDALAAGQRAWIGTLTRAARQAVEQGQLAADTDVEQIAFELFGIALVVHHHRRLLGYEKARARALAAFETLLERFAVSSEARAKLRAHR
ncbi:MAG TPA: TetR/AcrR family transcriptional regulator [Burkholderiales bacterium]|jgi:AcrR family transcriptional regulator|nr:TetR/AcrR family transcriptional regulator [Burkholderiales bacterium]